MVFVPVGSWKIKKLRRFGLHHWSIYKCMEHSSRLLKVKISGWRSKKVYSAIGHWYWIFSFRICQSLYDLKPKALSERCAPYWDRALRPNFSLFAKSKQVCHRSWPGVVAVVSRRRSRCWQRWWRSRARVAWASTWATWCRGCWRPTTTWSPACARPPSSALWRYISWSGRPPFRSGLFHAVFRNRIHMFLGLSDLSLSIILSSSKKL